MECKAERILTKISNHVGGSVTISRRGVPHLVLDIKGKPHRFSVCYFGKTKSLRVFYPYAVPGIDQSKETFKTWEEVVNYLKGMEQ